MNPRHGLSAETIQKIAEVLLRCTAVDRAVLFGSRAKGTQKTGSDIDLALVGHELDWRTVGKIYDRLDDLLLPYRFSLVVYDANTDAEVAAHIRRVGIPVFERPAVQHEVLQR